MKRSVFALFAAIPFVLGPNTALLAGDWVIFSPSDGAGPFMNDSSVSCSGETDDAPQSWECRITQTEAGGTQTSAVSGTSTENDDGDAVWSGTVSPPFRGSTTGNKWNPLFGNGTKSAAVELTDLATDNIEDTHSISFKAQ